MGGCTETNLAVNAVKSVEAAKPAQQGSYKTGQPYQVFGVWYYPKEDECYDETGIASWYGNEFQGRTTANGEVFDKNQVSAAHKTLPLPSVVQVTNLENGRQLVVRINDRGPFVNARVIDMSFHAAELLGYAQQGTAKVRVKILPEESRQVAAVAKGVDFGLHVPAVPRVQVVSEELTPIGPEAPPRAVARPPSVIASAEAAPIRVMPKPNLPIYVQAGAFAQRANAEKLRQSLAQIGQTLISELQISGQTLYRVRLGPLTSVQDADAMLDKVIQSGHTEARIIVAE